MMQLAAFVPGAGSTAASGADGEFDCAESDGTVASGSQIRDAALAWLTADSVH
jgi:hypothetical protein